MQLGCFHQYAWQCAYDKKSFKCYLIRDSKLKQVHMFAYIEKIGMCIDSSGLYTFNQMIANLKLPDNISKYTIWIIDPSYCYCLERQSCITSEMQNLQIKIYEQLEKGHYNNKVSEGDYILEITGIIPKIVSKDIEIPICVCDKKSVFYCKLCSIFYCESCFKNKHSIPPKIFHAKFDVTSELIKSIRLIK
jgi:hypothetical protein